MNQLHDLGLTEAEEKVYRALLELGDTTRGPIVDTSGVAGSKVYELLAKLQEKGLAASYLKDKIRHFKPTHPDQLLRYVEQKKTSLAQTEVGVAQLLPALLAQYQSSKTEQEVELLSGMRGLESIFHEQVDVMARNEICYVMGGTKGEDEDAVQAFFKKIHLLRERKGIKTRMLFNSRQENSTKQLYSAKEYPGTQTRYLDHASPVAINIYKDRTVIIIFSQTITAIRIVSKDVAQSFIEQFETLWTRAK